MIFAVVILIFVAIGVIEIVTLIKEKKRREIITYVILLIPCVVVMAMLAFGVKIPDYHDTLEKIVDAITGN